MSKRLVINSFALMLVLIGGVGVSLAKPAQLQLMSTCSSGGVSCNCGAGHRCSANSSGVCTCGAD